MWLPLLLCDSNLHIPCKSACSCCPITCIDRQYILLIYSIYSTNSVGRIHQDSSMLRPHGAHALIPDQWMTSSNAFSSRVFAGDVIYPEKNPVTPGLEYRGGSCRAARLQADSVSCQEYEVSRVVSVRSKTNTWRWLSRVPLPRPWVPPPQRRPSGNALLRRISSHNRSRRKISLSTDRVLHHAEVTMLPPL